MLKLPYINGGAIKTWIKNNLNRDISKELAQQIAIKARKAEKRVLGAREFLKRIH